MKKEKTKIPEASSLRWLVNQFPITKKPKNDVDRISNAIHLYCEAGANKIEELHKELEELREIYEKEID